MNFTPVILRAKKIVAMTKLSEELVQDAANLESILTDALAFALAKEIDSKALNGSGVNEPLGLLKTDGIGLTDLAGTAIDIDHFIDVIFTLVGLNVEQPRIAAICNADVVKAIAKLKETGGLYIEPNAPDAWKNLRKLLTSQISTSSDKTNIFLGDFINLFVGMRQELSLEISRQASDDSGNSAFTQTQVWFKAYQRIDTLVVRLAAFHILKNAGV